MNPEEKKHAISSSQEVFLNGSMILKCNFLK